MSPHASSGGGGVLRPVGPPVGGAAEALRLLLLLLRGGRREPSVLERARALLAGPADLHLWSGEAAHAKLAPPPPTSQKNPGPAAPSVAGAALTGAGGGAGAGAGFDLVPCALEPEDLTFSTTSNSTASASAARNVLSSDDHAVYWQSHGPRPHWLQVDLPLGGWDALDLYSNPEFANYCPKEVCVESRNRKIQLCNARSNQLFVLVSALPTLGPADLEANLQPCL